MKKIIMRAGMSPLEMFDPAHILLNDSIGSNVGNLIYAYSVFRTLTQEDVEVVPNYYKVNHKDADKINEMYDAYVIPLADAFRPEFVGELRKMTQLIKKLKIPCIINGVGLRAPFEPGLDHSFSFDKDVKEFISTVLDKSAMVGVRGEITSAYLSRLGFQEGKDHTVIGCPSMYTFGRNLNIKEANVTPESMVCMNSSVLTTAEVHDFIERSLKQLPNHYFLPQTIKELRLLYTGVPYEHKQPCKNYPVKMTDGLYEEDRVRFFTNAPAWLKFLRQADFSFGGRLHGNIAATIAGVPSILIPHDARMRELTEYHNLTHVWAKDINKDTSLFDLIGKLDFQKVSREHGKNFDHYVDFLDKNGLDHIYKNGAEPAVAPLDKLIKASEEVPSVQSIKNCSFEEMVERWQKYHPIAEAKNERMKTEVKKLRIQVKDKDSEIKKLLETNQMSKELKDKEKKIKKSFLKKVTLAIKRNQENEGAK